MLSPLKFYPLIFYLLSYFMWRIMFYFWNHLFLFVFQGGVTEEQMLKFMGANISLSPYKAKKLLEVLCFLQIFCNTTIMVFSLLLATIYNTIFVLFFPG